MNSRGAALSVAAVLLACGGGVRREHGAPMGEAGLSGEAFGGGSGVGGSEPAHGGRNLGGSFTNGGGRDAGDAGRVTVGGSAAVAGAESSGATGGAGVAGSPSVATGGSGSNGSNAGASGFAGSAGSENALPKKFCGNIDTRNAADPAGLKFSTYWDQLTPETAGKWGSVQADANGDFRWSVLDADYEYAQANGILFKESNFVWGAGQPSRATAVHVENWMRSFCQRYPNTRLIDVVMDPPPHTTPSYAQSLGVGESGTFPWIVKAFKLARMHCPKSVLILNDFNNLEFADEQDHFIELVNSAKDAGAPIDAVGAEGHRLKGMSASALKASLDRLASKTGLPVYITEYDIGDSADDVQLANYQAHFPVFWQSPAVQGVTVWGWIVGSTWISGSGLVEGNSPRPAMNWLMTQLGRPVLPP